MIGGRSALLAASGDVGPYGNWTGNYSDVSLLLRGGVAAGPLIPFDESPTTKTLSVIGNTNVNTTTFKYGNSSLFFDGSGDAIGLGVNNSTYAFGADNFTVEAWVYRIGTSTALIYTGQSNNATAVGSSLVLYVSSSASSDIYVGGAAYSITSPNPSANQWAHVAWVRQGGIFRSFLDGNLVGSRSDLGTASINVGSTSSQAQIGMFTNGGAPFNGYIDDFRITKSIARYEVGTGANANKMVFAGTNNLALPAAELPANVTDDPSYNSVLLLLRNGTPGLVPADESSTPKTITVFSDVRIDTTTFKYGGSALVAGTSPNFTWGSNRIQVSAGAAFAYGTGDFTVEAWIYPTSASDGIFWGQTVSGTNYFVCQTSADLRPAFIFATSGGGTSVFGPVITLNQWSHVAIVRSAGQVKVYSNGVGGTAVACAQDFSDTTFIPTIGSYTHNVGQLVFSGLIDDLRVTKGIARYKKDFLPPPAQLPAI